MALAVSIVSAEAEIWSGEASQIVARTVEGEIGILTGHEPVLAVLASGQVRVTPVDGAVISVDAEDGFLSVDRNRVEIVARHAQLA